MEHLPVKTTLRIALVGDYNPNVIAHQAIPLAIDDAAAVLELTADYDWLATTELTSPEDLVGYDAIWLVPASPYKNPEAAFIAARYARENSIPFLGTCGGFQHALIEYARNVLGWSDAAHAETDTEGSMVIAPLTCSLVEKTDAIELRSNTLIAKAYGKPEIEEGYHCNYGVSPAFAQALESGAEYLLVEQDQLYGRALLWDREQDRSAQAGFNEARVAQQPYVYQTKA